MTMIVPGPSKEETSYIYVMVRKDICIEQQLVQVAHAAVEAGASFSASNETSNLVLLEADSREDLEKASFKLREAGIAHRLFFEPDNGLGHCAFATQPLRETKDRRLFKRYRLYRQDAPGR